MATMRHTARSAEAVQPASMRRREAQGSHRPPRTRAYLDKLSRAPEPQYPHGQPPLHTPDECVLKEGREPRTCAGDLLHALQFRPHSPDHARYPGDGRWRVADALVARGYHARGRGEFAHTSALMPERRMTTTVRRDIDPAKAGVRWRASKKAPPVQRRSSSDAYGWVDESASARIICLIRPAPKRKAPPRERGCNETRPGMPRTTGASLRFAALSPKAIRTTPPGQSRVGCDSRSFLTLRCFFSHRPVDPTSSRGRSDEVGSRDRKSFASSFRAA
jgi:hypothetical protein